MIKAIVMDMDGTLLNAENKMDPITQQALLDLEKQGIQLVLASGRSYTRLLPYAAMLEMDRHNGTLLEVDGVARFDLAKNEREKFHTMDKEELRDILEFLKTQEVESMACFDDGLYDFIHPSLMPLKEKLRKEQNVPEDFPWTAGPWTMLSDLRDGYPNIAYIWNVDDIQVPINKLQIMQDEAHIADLFQKLQARFGDQFEIFRTTPRQLEVLPKGFNKGGGLKKIMEEKGWGPDEVLVFGDGENDVSMFGVVKDSYAMGNAQDFVKAQAAHVAGRNDENGIVQALIGRGMLPSNLLQ